jgi:hypothetical protein
MEAGVGKLTDRQVRAQIVGVLVSKLRMACVVDGDEIDDDRYFVIQQALADTLENKYIPGRATLASRTKEG